jgi:hypothetical protein
MRSHFLPSPRATTACAAVAGAASLLHGTCCAQTLIAADYATNTTYAAGWYAGTNGGYGFGPWSFDGTNPDPAGLYQGITNSSALGTSWTLLTYSTTTGLANAGRAILQPAGLQPGQTFETVIQNPTGYVFYRGFDILFYNGTANLPGGENAAALRMVVFSYHVNPPEWAIVDDLGSPHALDVNTTGAAGMKVDFTLLSTNTYSFTMTPLSNPSAAYSQTGTFKANLPINWVDYRLWWGFSTGLDDVTDNFEISSMTVAGLTLNIHRDKTNVVLTWTTNAPLFQLVSTTNLVTPSWNSVLPLPVVVNGENAVTNPITGTQQYYRLKFQP